jgi:ribosomal protein S18 acetylase RimI-like enzyme
MRIAPVVSLRTMTTAEFESWQVDATSLFAADAARAGGEQIDAARDRALTLFSRLLPAGLDTDRTWLVKVLDPGGVDVGVLWVGQHPDRADALYVFRVEINEPHRGRGLGRAAMHAAEQLARDAGATGIGLNVFGDNDTARALYDSLGYTTVATQMIKILPAAPPS